MPRTRSLAWSELKIGLLTIVAIVIAAVLIFTLTGSKGFSWQRYSLKTRFDNVAGLATGSPVRVAGVEVGTVTAVDFAGNQVDVTFEIKETLRPRVTDRSVATLGSVSLLGESAVDVTPAAGGTPIPEWGYVPAGKPAVLLSEMGEKLSGGVEQITRLVDDVRQGRGTVGKLMTDDRLYTDLQQFAASAGDVVQTMKTSRGTIGKLLNDRKIADALEATSKNIEELTRTINAGQGSIGKLLKDDAFSNSLTGVSANLRTLTDRLNRGEGTVGKLMTEDALYNRIDSVVTRLDELVNRLNAGEGTAGQLLKDKQLYENMNGAISEFKALLAAIKGDPKKYLNVKVSIF